MFWIILGWAHWGWYYFFLLEIFHNKVKIKVFKFQKINKKGEELSFSNFKNSLLSCRWWCQGNSSCLRCFTCRLVLHIHSILTVTILQMKKPRPKEIKSLSQGHTTSKWQNCGSLGVSYQWLFPLHNDKWVQFKYK